MTIRRASCWSCRTVLPEQVSQCAGSVRSSFTSLIIPSTSTLNSTYIVTLGVSLAMPDGSGYDVARAFRLKGKRSAITANRNRMFFICALLHLTPRRHSLHRRHKHQLPGSILGHQNHPCAFDTPHLARREIGYHRYLPAYDRLGCIMQRNA